MPIKYKKKTIKKYYCAARLEKWWQGSMSPTRAGQFPTELELEEKKVETLSSLFVSYNCYNFSPQVGVQPQEADSLHLLHAHAQVNICK